MHFVRTAGSEQAFERPSAWRDLALVALVTCFGGLLATYFELSESLFAWTRPWEHWQLDELAVALLVLTLCLTWFAWRRYRDARAELDRRRAAEAQLASLLLDNRRLAQQYVRVQEAERKFLARELHDELGQYLNAIKIDAVAIQERAADRTSPFFRASSAIIAHTDHVHAVVRDLIRKLRPVGLDEFGPKAALDCCVEVWRKRLPHVQFDVCIEENLDTVSEPLALALYRLVQEGLTNVSRHARAGHVEIRLLRSPAGPAAPDEVAFSMVDDGSGTDLSERKAGLGLIGMRERVEMLGGQLRVITAPARGFGIHARIPAGSARSESGR